MIDFKEVTIVEALELIKEADDQKAFLPSVSEPNFSVEEFFNKNSSPNFLLFGSFLNKKPAGFISVILNENNTVDIGPMYISEIFRGKGLGKLQVEKIVNWAKQNKLKGIFTRTWGKNLASRKIFEDLGFKLVEEKLNARINGDSTIKYCLEN